MREQILQHIFRNQEMEDETMAINTKMCLKQEKNILMDMVPEGGRY